MRCRGCGTILYETTKHYNCHKPLTGDMLRLLPLYKGWPTYDGSLAVKSTSRFLMFCSNCANYVTPDGKLTFPDFPDKVGISEERSKLADRHEFNEAIASVCINVVRKTRCRIDGSIEISPDIEKELSQKAEPEPLTPKELSAKMDKLIGRTGSTPKRKPYTKKGK